VRLLALRARDWRNVAGVSADCDARFVVLAGENAQGKTNLLEGVWTLATLRSFRESRPRRLVREGAGEAALGATVRGESGTRSLGWSLQADGARALRVDERPARGLEEWFGLLRAVLFCPEHLDIVRGDPVARRSFVDRAAFTASPAHLGLVRDYKRVVDQKAALLRSAPHDRASLAAWDAHLIRLGALLSVRRARILDDLRGPFAEMHAAIAGPEPVELGLSGVGAAAVDGREAAEAAIAAALDRASGEEARRRMVLAGPHRDDLLLTVDGRPARAFASQGQARSLVLALKLAELEAARRRGEAPLFLLDDLTSELDARRMRRLVALLADLPNQVWITTTDPGWLGPLPGGDARIFRVEAGSVRADPSVDEGPRAR